MYSSGMVSFWIVYLLIRCCSSYLVQGPEGTESFPSCSGIRADLFQSVANYLAQQLWLQQLQVSEMSHLLA